MFYTFAPIIPEGGSDTTMQEPVSPAGLLILAFLTDRLRIEIWILSNTPWTGGLTAATLR